MSVFGQVWLWSLAAFVLGALLTWLLLVRPARARVRELERRVVAHRAEPVAASPDVPAPANGAAPVSNAARPGHGAEPGFGPDAGARQPDTAAVDSEPWAGGEQRSVPDRSSTGDPATELFEPANAERTEYLQPADKRTRVDLGPDPGPPGGSDIGTALEPGWAGTSEPQQPEFGQPEFGQPEFGHTESRHAAPEPSRGLFQPALPSTPPYEPEPALPEPAPLEPGEAELGEAEPGEADHGEAEHGQHALSSEALLPKRQRRDSPLGGFDPPEPIQPSMRAVTRREPVQGGHSGSLFEPSMPDEPGLGAEDDDAAPEGQSAAEQPAAGQSESGAPVGPFGPGSAMPLPGGAKPSEDFTVKASVTTLRYCPPDSENVDDIVAEVWFRTAQDAERVGFRPIG